MMTTTKPTTTTMKPTTTVTTMSETTEPVVAATSSTSTIRRSLASIRVRIVVGYLVLMAIGLVIAVVVTRQVQLARAHREIEQAQAQEVEELRALAGGVNPKTGQPFGGDVGAIFDTFLIRNVPSDGEAFYTIVDDRGYLYSSSSPDLFSDRQFLEAWRVDVPTNLTTTTGVADVGEVRSLAVPLFADGQRAGVFVVAHFPDNDEAEVAQVVRVVALAGLAVLLVTAALAWTLAGRVLRPVRQLTSTARQITESDLSARIPVVGHDELAELGHTFNDMVGRIERGFSSQRRFLDDVAHELRTPITIARGHLEFLGDDPGERAETVEIVTDELDRMSRYVTDLLLLAKSEQPDFLVPGTIDLGELALDLHHRVRGVAPRAWVLDAAPPVGSIAVTADRERVIQAVVNLAANASQHTGEGAEIGIGVAVDGNGARIWVRDTGPGVDPAIVEHIFDRYSRAATNRTSRPDGTGIGLSIVDAIARAHGGSARVDNVPGQGATFTITIPLAPWSPPVASALAPPPPHLSPARSTF
jgi:two-component system, OmpR family, sensor kinase